MKPQTTITLTQLNSQSHTATLLRENIKIRGSGYCEVRAIYNLADALVEAGCSENDPDVLNLNRLTYTIGSG